MIEKNRILRMLDSYIQKYEEDLEMPNAINDYEDSNYHRGQLNALNEVKETVFRWWNIKGED